tara:strand:+ start:26540 stop:28306 length:1767 start_codon:yes stop_codon:yes gene_type:complete
MNNLWHALRLKVIRGTLLANFLWTLLSLAIGYLIMHIGLEDRMKDYVLKDLKENLHFIARPFQNQTQATVVNWCHSIVQYQGKRLTVIDQAGVVLCDNYADVDDLVNHSDRPEFIDAMEKGSGESNRSSSSIDKLMLYASIRLEDSQTKEPFVLRIALAQGELSYYLSKMRSLVLKNLIAVLLILSTIFVFSSLRVGNPLRRLEKKLSRFNIQSSKNMGAIPQSEDEWEKVDLSVDRIYHELESKIDEVEASNDKITTIVDSIADGVIAIDSDEQVILTNHNFKKVIELTSDIELQGKSLIDIIRNVDIRFALQSVVKTKKPISTQVSLATKTYQLRVYPLLREMGAVAIFHDISQEQLVQQMREDFVANVSHEVRTPLTALKGYTQILSDLSPTDSDSFAEYTDKIERNVDRLTALFQDILSLSVLESRQAIAKESLNSSEIILSVLSNIKMNYAEKNFIFTVDNKVSTIHGDCILIEQILTNLLDNACKYSPATSNISIKVFKASDNNIIHIIDQGPGIPEASLTRVFERFYRVDESRSRAIGGTGLGLAIVKHAVQKHNGKVSVWNNDGQGTTFEISLPIPNQSA